MRTYINAIIPSAASRACVVVALCSVIALPGCTESVSTPPPLKKDVVPYLTTQEFKQLVKNSSGTVLAEFSVPIGCVRCDQMRPQLESLVTQLSEETEVCRINLNYERELVADLGITVCPTFVAYERGQEVFRVTYPTSGDLLLTRLEENMSRP